jgi:alpha-tubulin suppressor-like RCC1 family protein
MKLGTSSQNVSGPSLRARYGAAALAAAALLAVGCSTGHHAAGQSSADRVSPSVTAAQPVTSTVLHWGSFFDDYFSNADTQVRPVPVELPGTVKEVGSSNSTEYALLTNGQLYAWGLGGQGELGNGLLGSSFTTAVHVLFPAGVKIAWIPTDVMPYDTALAVDTTGHLWGWGADAIGELCLGNTFIQSSPVELPFSNVTAVSGAADHMIVDAGGTVYACGQNVDGDLGDGQTADTLTAQKVVGLSGKDVTDLVTSFANSGALLSDGRYYDWGYNDDGQLGDGHPGKWSDVPVLVHLPHPVKQVALGGSIWGNGETLAMLSDGSLWDWGSNYAYQLGIGNHIWQALPVRFHAPKGVTYKLLAAGSATGYAVTTSGAVYAWGVSHAGQAGAGTLGVVKAPVQVASRATMISATANNAVVAVQSKP